VLTWKYVKPRFELSSVHGATTGIRYTRMYGRVVCRVGRKLERTL